MKTKTYSNRTALPLADLLDPFSYEVRSTLDSGAPYTLWIRYAQEHGTSYSSTRGLAFKVKTLNARLCEEVQLGYENKIQDGSLLARMIALDPIPVQRIANHYERYEGKRPLSDYLDEALIKVLTLPKPQPSKLYAPLINLLNGDLGEATGLTDNRDALKMAVNNMVYRIALNLFEGCVIGNNFVKVAGA